MAGEIIKHDDVLQPLKIKQDFIRQSLTKINYGNLCFITDSVMTWGPYLYTTVSSKREAFHK